MKVGYLGPSGTYAEEALLRLVGPEPEQAFVPYPTIIDCFRAVRDGEVPEALVPIENSIEGSVNLTLDQLAAADGQIAILAEIVQPVRHHLAARTRRPFGEITRVLSHPHATPQCTGYLREHLPRAETVATGSTAEAMRVVSQSDEPWAAIGTLRAADIYGLEVLAADIEDARDNATRFVLIGRTPGEALGPGSFVTSIICIPPRDRPGVLLAILQEFAMRAVNLTKLESRPAKTGLGRYLFFIDMDGSRDRDLAVAAAIQAIEEQGVARAVFLGSYPRSAPSG